MARKDTDVRRERRALSIVDLRRCLNGCRSRPSVVLCARPLFPTQQPLPPRLTHTCARPHISQTHTHSTTNIRLWLLHHAASNRHRRGQFTEIHIHPQTRIVICFLCYESPVLYDINQCFFFFLYTSGYRERFYERSTTLMEKNRGVCSSFVDVLDSCGPALDCERDALPVSGYLSSSQSATYSPVIEKPSESVTTILC